MFDAVLPKFDTFKLADTLSKTLKLVDTMKLANVANTVKLVDTVKLAETFRLADTVRLFDAALPKFDTAELARDVEIAARWLEAALHQEVDAGGLDVDVVTWWTCLPPSLRTATVMIFVWILVLGRLATWSADHPDVSKYIQDHTGITPVAVATAAAWAARAGYKWCSSN
jgi:hypothetical protein